MIKSLRVTWCNHERVFWPVFEFIFRAFYALWAKIIVTSVFDLCTPELITNPFEEEEQRKEREKESWNLEEEKQLCSAWVWIGGFTTAFYSRIATNQCCKKKMLKKTNFMTIGFQIALWKICAKYRPFQIVSFMQEARISYTKTSQTKSRTFHNNLSVCGLLIIRYISPRLIKDKVEVQFLGKFFSSDALRVFLYQFIAISRGTGC